MSRPLQEGDELGISTKILPTRRKTYPTDFTSDHNEVGDPLLNRRLAGKPRNEKYPGSSVGKNPLAALNLFPLHSSCSASSAARKRRQNIKDDKTEIFLSSS